MADVNPIIVPMAIPVGGVPAGDVSHGTFGSLLGDLGVYGFPSLVTSAGWIANVAADGAGLFVRAAGGGDQFYIVARAAGNGTQLNSRNAADNANASLLINATVVTVTKIMVTGGTFSVGTIYSDAAIGLVIVGTGGTASDMFFTDSAGNEVLVFAKASSGGGGVNDASFARNLAITGLLTLSGGTLLSTSAGLSNNAGAQAGTLLNSPVAGNPTKWLVINDNGTLRNVPAW